MNKHYVASTTRIKATKWQYQLEIGLALRQAVEDEDYEGIVSALYAAYQELLDNGFIDEDDYERYTEDLEMYDMDDSDIDEELNFELDQLYDLCDNLHIWVSVD